MLVQFISDFLAVLHHESNSFQLADVGYGITGNSDHVGEFSGLKRTNAILPAEHFCSVRRDGAKNVKRGHPGLMQDWKPRDRGLPPRFPGEVPAHVGTSGELYSKLQNPLDQTVV